MEPISPTDARRARNGLLASLAATSIWGGVPLYLRMLRELSPLSVMSHRVIWSCVLVYGWLWLRGEARGPWLALRDAGTRWKLVASAILVSCNWLTFIYAVQLGRTLDASLGYFISPLVNVLLGVLVLGERLSAGRWAAVALASAGVLWLALFVGEPPWIALILASCWGSYSLLRKIARVEAVPGLAAETLLITPFALAYLAWPGQAVGPALDGALLAWLMVGGVVTALPLALFAYGARMIPLSTVGFLGYVAPSLQFLLGRFVFGEPFAMQRAIGFALTWSALLLFASEDVVRAVLSRRRARGAPGTAPK